MNEATLTTVSANFEGQAPLTMSTIEIAEITGKQHKHVLADTRKMLESLGLHWADFSAEYKDSTGRTLPCANLPKRETFVLMSGYSTEMRAKIVDRWMELEASPPSAVINFADPKVMLGVFQHLQEQVSAKDAIIVQQGERLQHLDRIEATVGSMCMTDAAKTLKIGPQKLIQFMSTRSWIYKRAGNASWLARQDKITAGYMEHKEHIYIDSLGQERVSTRALVTGKGLVKLAELLHVPLH